MVWRGQASSLRSTAVVGPIGARLAFQREERKNFPPGCQRSIHPPSKYTWLTPHDRGLERILGLKCVSLPTLGAQRRRVPPARRPSIENFEDGPKRPVQQPAVTRARTRRRARTPPARNIDRSIESIQRSIDAISEAALRLLTVRPPLSPNPIPSGTCTQGSSFEGAWIAQASLGRQLHPAGSTDLWVSATAQSTVGQC